MTPPQSGEAPSGERLRGSGMHGVIADNTSGGFGVYILGATGVATLSSGGGAHN